MSACYHAICNDNYKLTSETLNKIQLNGFFFKKKKRVAMVTVSLHRKKKNSE